MRSSCGSGSDQRQDDEGLEAGVRWCGPADGSVGLDRAVRSELEANGYPGSALRLLDLMPLVMVAWADGIVSIRERDVILDTVLRRGLTFGHPEYRQFVAWLAVQPADSLFRASLRALSARLRQLPSAVERDDSLRRILAGCERVAAAAEDNYSIIGPVSKVERRAIADIAAALVAATLSERAA